MTKTKAFLTSDNQVFLTREDAQRHELEGIFDAAAAWPKDGPSADDAARVVLTNADQIVAILSTRKPRTPKCATARKSRKAAVNAATQDMKP